MRIVVVLLLMASPSLGAAFDDNWLWEVSCKEKDYGTIYQYRVSTDMIQKRVDFGIWTAMPSHGLPQEMVVEGSDTSLYISTMGASTIDPVTIHLVWWNYSNPHLYNSFELSPSWSDSGSVRTSLQYFNCIADKTPTVNFRRRIGFISRDYESVDKQHLDGKSWTKTERSSDASRLKFIKESEKAHIDMLRKKFGLDK